MNLAAALPENINLRPQRVVGHSYPSSLLAMLMRIDAGLLPRSESAVALESFCPLMFCRTCVIDVNSSVSKSMKKSILILQTYHQLKQRRDYLSLWSVP